MKHKTTVGNELTADWHVWVDRISAQKGQKRDWTRSTIFCFWEAQLAFYKHTSTNWSFTSKYERGSLNLQQASSPRAGAKSNPIYGIKWESYCYLLLSCSGICISTNQSTEVKLPPSSRQYYLHMTKRLWIETLKQFEHNQNIIHSVLAGSSLPPANSLLVLLHIPLTLSSSKGNSLCHCFFFRASIQPPSYH